MSHVKKVHWSANDYAVCYEVDVWADGSVHLVDVWDLPPAYGGATRVTDTQREAFEAVVAEKADYFRRLAKHV